MRGVAFMHSRNIAHRDISLENILMDENHMLKICDLGVACESPPGTLVAANTGPCGKLPYMAPEVLNRYPHCARKADVWSCGIVLFVMLVRVFPFDQPSLSDDRFARCCSGRINEMLQAWGKEKLEDTITDLMAHIFTAPDQRWDAEQILRHPYCSGMNLQQPAQQRAHGAGGAAPSAASVAPAAAAAPAAASQPGPSSAASSSAMDDSEPGAQPGS
jgi:serine/threonine protein kinase